AARMRPAGRPRGRIACLAQCRSCAPGLYGFNLGRRIEVLWYAAQANPLKETPEFRMGREHTEWHRKQIASCQREAPQEDCRRDRQQSTADNNSKEHLRPERHDSRAPRDAVHIAGLCTPCDRLSKRKADHEYGGPDGRDGTKQKRKHELDQRTGSEPQPATVACNGT